MAGEDSKNKKINRKWRIVKFTSSDGVRAEVRAVPERWVFILNKSCEESTAYHGQDIPTDTPCQVYWPKFRFEYQVTNVIAKNSNYKQTAVWEKHDGIVWTNAATYKEALKKESLSRDYSGSEIDVAYDEIVSKEADKKMRKERKKKVKHSSEESGSSSDESEEDEDGDAKNSVEYPVTPDQQLFQTEGGDDKKITGDVEETSEKTSDAIGLHSLDAINGEVSQKSPPTSSKERPVSDLDYSCVSTANDKKRSSLEDSPAAKRVKQEKQANTDTLSNHSFNVDDDVNDTENGNIQECQGHNPEDLKGFAVMSVEELNQVLTVPYGWLTLDMKFCYYPPEGSENITTNYIMKRVPPQVGWQKFTITESYDWAETYLQGLKTIRAVEKLKAKENHAPKLKIIDEFAVHSQRSTSNNKKPALLLEETEELSDREMMKVIYSGMQSIQANQNKILVTVSNPCSKNQQSIIQGRSFHDEVNDDIKTCKTLVAINELEKKVTNDKNYRRNFKTVMKSHAGPSGKAHVERMISLIFPDKVLVKFSFGGRESKKRDGTKKENIKFEALELWSIFREAALEQDPLFTTDLAKKTADVYVRLATRRIERKQNSKRKKTLEDAAQEEEEN